VRKERGNLEHRNKKQEKKRPLLSPSHHRALQLLLLTKRARTDQKAVIDVTLCREKEGESFHSNGQVEEAEEEA
jgi:hypothetical protein